MSVNHEAVELYKNIRVMISKWKESNRGKEPRYLFLSPDALTLLISNQKIRVDFTTNKYSKLMGIEIAPVGIKGVYAGLGDDFK